MAEKLNRMTPTLATIRELFAKSGNLCAFPGCAHGIINPAGEFIGQMCHIVAAEEGGERGDFDPAMTDEDRRHVSNLMLMCYEHHVVTNNVTEYTVPRLRRMKADHEAKFTDVERRIEKAFVDELLTTTVRGGITLARLSQTLKWPADAEKQSDLIDQFKAFAGNLKRVPRKTRQLLLALVGRAERQMGMSRLYVAHSEIAAVVNEGSREIVEHVSILEKYGIAFGERDDEHGADYIFIKDLESGWRIWDDLKLFSEKTSTSLHELIVDLNFSALD